MQKLAEICVRRPVFATMLIAALTVGWAPVVQTAHAAAAPGFALVDAGMQAAASLHHHEPMAGGDRHERGGKAAPFHLAVCAACVGLPAIWLPAAHLPAEAARQIAPAPMLAAIPGRPASPPPRA